MYFVFFEFNTHYYIILFWSTPPNTPWPPQYKTGSTPLQWFLAQKETIPALASWCLNVLKSSWAMYIKAIVLLLWLTNDFKFLYMHVWIIYFWFCNKQSTSKDSLWLLDLVHSWELQIESRLLGLFIPWSSFPRSFYNSKRWCRWWETFLTQAWWLPVARA